MANFMDELEKVARHNKSWLCVGLDPSSSVSDIFEFNQNVISSTVDLVCCYKMNTAFYESRGADGLHAMKKTVDYIKEYVRVPVIVDAKRADIANTSKALAKYVFEVLGGDAITVSPYMGYDAIEPFLERRNKGVFILCRTTNPGASDIQSLNCPEPLYQVVAKKAMEHNTNKNIGFVVGATQGSDLKAVRAIAGEHIPILIPGIGPQGGDLKTAVIYGMNSSGEMGIITSSRQVLSASSMRKAASILRDEINEYINEYRR
jgi:orotidine-5'-phosphate decarboxylase